MQITKEQLISSRETIEVSLNSWSEFETAVRELSEAYSELERDVGGMHLPHLLFRGQSRASYPLSTTLERYPKRIQAFSEYYDAIYGARFEIESASGTQWNIPYPQDMRGTLESTFEIVPPAYEYILYLRHHGFPSPILDWSRSPYIAAFFALSTCKSDQDDHVAIYSYLERTRPTKAYDPAQPTVYLMGPYARTHRRHYLQQAEYTMCRRTAGSDWVFAPHEQGMGGGGRNDVLLKFLVPASERNRGLESLDKYNLNAWSLYGSEEGLMETMALRQFEFSERIRRRELRAENLAERVRLSEQKEQSRGINVMPD